MTCITTGSRRTACRLTAARSGGGHSVTALHGLIFGKQSLTAGTCRRTACHGLSRCDVFLTDRLLSFLSCKAFPDRFAGKRIQAHRLRNIPLRHFLGRYLHNHLGHGNIHSQQVLIEAQQYTDGKNPGSMKQTGQRQRCHEFA